MKNRPMDVMTFLQSRAANGTRWRIDPDTEEMVTECETCGAEARHREEALGEFQFEHDRTCPHRGLGDYLKTEDKQAYELADGIIAAIQEAEKDDSLQSRTVLSTMAFVAAGICVACDDESTADAVTHTISELRHHVKVFGAIDLPKPEAPDRDLLSPAEARYLREGAELAVQVMKQIDNAHPAVALVALQHALIQVVTTRCPDRAVPTAMGCMQAVLTQVTKRAPGPDAEAA